MSLITTARLDQVPGEAFFISCLQKSINFSVSNKSVKRGKLILFQRFHYFIQLTLIAEKGSKENFDIPIPFKIEQYIEDGLMYFDYRIKSLEVDCLPRFPEKISSIFFDKILEIEVINTCKLVCL